MTRVRHKHKKLPPASVRLWGSVGPLESNQKKALHFSENLQASSTCLVPSPYERGGAGLRQVMEHKDGAKLHCDGVILKESGQAVIFSTHDCPVVVIVDTRNGVVGAMRAGLDSLMNYNPTCSACAKGVVETMMSAFDLPRCEDLRVYITGGISSEHLTYKTYKKKPRILQFIERFNHTIREEDETVALDLPRAISSILANYGVKPEQISTDGLCTFETPWLGSRRADFMKVANKSESNWVWVRNGVQ